MTDRIEAIRDRWEKANRLGWPWDDDTLSMGTSDEPKVKAIANAPEDVAWLLAEVKEARDDAAHWEAEYDGAVAEIARRDKVLDEVRVAFRACFAPDFGGWDWRDDDAVQTLARSLSRAFSSLNTSSTQESP